MSAATPTPQDSGLPPPPAPAPAPVPSSSSPTTTIPTFAGDFKVASNKPKPTILHLGDDIRWNHALYAELTKTFHVERSYSMGRADFKQALQDKKWGDFVGMYRPFWNTGGEMGNWDKELIALLPRSCRIYASAGAGFDWVDTKTMAEHGIIYCNSAPACTESVADAAIFLILSTFRAMVWSFMGARSLDVERFRDANQNVAAVTHNPNNHVLGIIGLGKIGFRIAQKAAVAFEMRIRYHDVVRLEDREESLKGMRGIDGKEIEVTWCPTLDELLETSDCILLATPFSGSVLLSTEQFGHFKRGSRLVNIARGKLIDEDALVKALDEGLVVAAGLDVHADEPRVNERLAGRDNVMVLSHTAGASVESHIGFERLGMENLLQFLGGGEAITPVNIQWLKEDDVKDDAKMS